VEVQRHPTGMGVLVLFGTGQYLNAEDKTDLQVQTFYGIWDDGGRVYGDAGTT
jgi:type IV pilus assembly protein PilY1